MAESYYFHAKVLSYFQEGFYSKKSTWNKNFKPTISGKSVNSDFCSYSMLKLAPQKSVFRDFIDNAWDESLLTTLK